MTKCFRLSVGVVALCLCAVSVSSYAVQTSTLPGTLPTPPDTWRDDPTGGGSSGGGSSGSGGGTGGGLGTDTLPADSWITTTINCSNDYECNVPDEYYEGEDKYLPEVVALWAEGKFNNDVPQYEILEVTNDYGTSKIMKVVYVGLCRNVRVSVTGFNQYEDRCHNNTGGNPDVYYGCAPGYYGLCSDPEDTATCECDKCPNYRDTADQQQSDTALSYGVNYMYASNFSVPTTEANCYFQPTASYYTNSKGVYTIPSACPYQE